MTKVTPFHPSHFGALRPRFNVQHITPEYLGALAAEPSITIWCDHIPVVCGGVLGECEVWAVFDFERATQHRWSIIREIRAFLMPYRFLYTNVEGVRDEQLPHRMLGFRRRGPAWRNGRRMIHLERVA
jgi:hypothetical protein